jgi:putative hydrolase of HD superfamily
MPNRHKSKVSNDRKKWYTTPLLALQCAVKCRHLVEIINLMQEIQKLKRLYALKSVYRANSVDTRKESAAEHTWSALILADYYAPQVSQPLNTQRVYELLLYHDVVEILAGDTPLTPLSNAKEQSQKEWVAAVALKEQLPYALQDKYWDCFVEFEQRETVEAQFAKAIDALDAVIQELDYKEDWVGWTKEFLLAKKERYLENFPTLLKDFHQIVDHLEGEGYFNQ